MAKSPQSTSVERVVTTDFGNVLVEDIPLTIREELEAGEEQLPWWRFIERRKRRLRWEFAMSFITRQAQFRWEGDDG